MIIVYCVRFFLFINKILPLIQLTFIVYYVNINYFGFEIFYQIFYFFAFLYHLLFIINFPFVYINNKLPLYFYLILFLWHHCNIISYRIVRIEKQVSKTKSYGNVFYQAHIHIFWGNVVPFVMRVLFRNLDRPRRKKTVYSISCFLQATVQLYFIPL